MIKTRNLLIAEAGTPPAPIRSALAAGCPGSEAASVTFGELRDYLRRTGRFASGTYPLPDLILADISGAVDAFAVLTDIKGDPSYRRIPLIVFVSPGAPADLVRFYSMGINSVIETPLSAEAFAGLLKALCVYWFEHVELAAH